MQPITFIDLEVDQKGNVADFGGVSDDGRRLHSHSISDFTAFIRDSKFLAGHNILSHDLKFIRQAIHDARIDENTIIDTLYLSPLLFPGKPYHNLLKDDKLQTEELNNPLNDSLKARDLFHDEVTAFHELPQFMKDVFYLLLNDQPEFRAFFRFLDFPKGAGNIRGHIQSHFRNQFCEHADLPTIIADNPIEVAYCITLIHNADRYSITPPWVLKNFPAVDRVMTLLRNKPCLEGCVYCNRSLDIRIGLREYFGYTLFRTYADEPLQENAVQAAVHNQSILAVFPTGGGKSITFQLPALMAGRNTKGLTVVISPLQSLMKDQVDNLEKTHSITEAVSINGLLDPVERAKSIERVYDGSAALLYISPESLRSKTIENLLLGRKIERFVIDEAHCFSSWGQDFRVDYLYIGDFIKSLQEKKNLREPIPVSCFTATAKQKVIEDIREYFREKLSLELKIFRSTASRTNLTYEVFEKEDDEGKYNTMRDLIDAKSCPTIVYVARTKRADDLAYKLKKDGFNARAFHGKMDVKDKIANQDAFISGEVQIIVATSAFGMGVDKKDVGLVMHYDISDSLENYIQEAGRAGRDEEMQADCYVLYNEEDLSKHFILLNQTRLSVKEIQQVWKAIKDLTRFKLQVSNSALEIARKAGWDDNIKEIETRVTTAIAALEDAGYLKRGQNVPRVFANSILAKTAQEAIDRIDASTRFNEDEKSKAARIIRKLFSSKSRKQASEEIAESRIDYISDHLGIKKEEVIRLVTLLREEKILADTKDLTAFIKRNENKNRSQAITDTFNGIENFLIETFSETTEVFHLKDLNEQAELAGCAGVSVEKLQTIVNYWAIKNWIRRRKDEYSTYHVKIRLGLPKDELKEKQQKRQELARFIIGLLFERSQVIAEKDKNDSPEILVEFSVGELKAAFERQIQLFSSETSTDEIEDALFYLSKIGSIKIEGGFLVVYNRLSIHRLEKDNKRRYKLEDYEKLGQFYENKIQQIHIVGEFARKMVENYKEALQFVDDYFQLNYSVFLDKYFPNKQKEISRSITPKKFRQLFGELSPDQLAIIRERKANYLVVKAGPGSGKTKVLAHKLASLLMMEEVKHEQLLMLTFSRAAASEFKKRLIELVGPTAQFVEIRTFHSYCFDLLGKVGSLDKSDKNLVKRTIEKIKAGEVEVNRITKTVVVIDEAQDMNEDEYALIETLIDKNEELRLIAVGDDDQNIYEFRGSNSQYFNSLLNKPDAMSYELVDNYRSKTNLVEFANQFASGIRNRMKSIPIRATQPASGRINIIHHQNGNLIVPLVNDILSANLTGTTGVLTITNEEALLVTGLLRQHNRPARLIQSNDGFSLYYLAELRFFMNELEAGEQVITISDDAWKSAKQGLELQFHRSDKLELCKELIRDFETLSPKVKYRSDLDIFIRESCLDDFYRAKGETILVSTIHKAKGKEFDQVFLLLDHVDVSTDEKKRVLYVGLTRAKEQLNIHLTGSYLKDNQVEDLTCLEDNAVYEQPDVMAFQLAMTDVWLSYSKNYQAAISQLVSGDKLRLIEGKCYNTDGQKILWLSKEFEAKLEAYFLKGFRVREVKVNFMVWWKGKDVEKEIQVVLPEIMLER